MHRLHPSFVTSLLVLGAQIATAPKLAPPSTLEEALAAEFKCPSGAHDSGRGPSPGVVVRWCDVQRNGRPVYHGPLWRWYPSGKLESKEYYVNGDAAGVWPSYYENGRMLSLGAWEDGYKRGLWKYWDDGGHLITEVTYLDDGNLRTDYYASGRKKAVGVFTESGKIAKWTYWDPNGVEKARCDFGQGVFRVSDRACQTIADELNPKGYSPPIPRGSKDGDGTLAVSVGSRVFKFTAPRGWVADVDKGRREGLPLVFFPEGKEWRGPGANIYIRVCFKGGRSFNKVIKDDKMGFEQGAAEYHERSGKYGRLPAGFEYLLSSIVYKPVIETDSPFSIVASNQIHERVAYLDASDEIVLLLILAADSDRELQQSVPVFQSILQSAR